MDITPFFFTSMGIILFLFIKRKAVSDFVFEKLDIEISTKGVTYILFFSIAIVFIIGTLLSDQKGKYSQISSSYDKMRPKQQVLDKLDTKEKPHRWFDINFNIFNF
jgi:hypothetical protein